MFNFQFKKYKRGKETRKGDSYTGEKKLIKVAHEEYWTLNLLEKKFKLSILNVQEKLKETMSKEVRESVRIMPHLVETVNKQKLLKRAKQKFWS